MVLVEKKTYWKISVEKLYMIFWLIESTPDADLEVHAVQQYGGERSLLYREVAQKAKWKASVLS